MKKLMLSLVLLNCVGIKGAGQFGNKFYNFAKQVRLNPSTRYAVNNLIGKGNRFVPESQLKSVVQELGISGSSKNMADLPFYYKSPAELAGESLYALKINPEKVAILSKVGQGASRFAAENPGAVATGLGLAGVTGLAGYGMVDRNQKMAAAALKEVQDLAEQRELSRQALEYSTKVLSAERDTNERMAAERDANERMLFAATQDVQDATQILNDALGGLNEAKLTASADMEGYQAAKNEVQLAKQQLIEASLNALSLQNQTPEVIAQTEELNDQWGNLNRDRSDMSWKESLSDDADALVQGLRHIAYNPKVYGQRRSQEAQQALKNAYTNGSRFVGQKAQEAKDVLRDAYESASDYIGNKTQPFKNRLQPWVDYIKSLDYGRLNPMRYMTRKAEAQAAQDDMNEIVKGMNYEMPMNYDVPGQPAPEAEQKISAASVDENATSVSNEAGKKIYLDQFPYVIDRSNAESKWNQMTPEQQTAAVAASKRSASVV